MPLMKRAGLVCAAIGALSCSFWAQAEDLRVSIVLSRSIPPYLHAVSGVQEALAAANIRNVQVHDLAGDISQTSRIVEELGKTSPQLIVTVGTEATQAISRQTRDIPLVFSMVMHPETFLTPADARIFGASMEVSAEQQLAYLKAALPQARRIGVLFNPSRQTPAAMEHRQQAAQAQHVELVLQPVRLATDVSGTLQSLLPEIDALWLIPDETVLAPETVQTLFLETLRSHVPVLAPSLMFVQRGALLAVSSDYKEVGRQAGEVAVTLLAGAQPAHQVTDARKAVLYLNLRSARALGVTLPQALIEEAEQVVE